MDQTARLRPSRAKLAAGDRLGPLKISEGRIARRAIVGAIAGIPNRPLASKRDPIRRNLRRHPSDADTHKLASPPSRVAYIVEWITDAWCGHPSHPSIERRERRNNRFGRRARQRENTAPNLKEKKPSLDNVPAIIFIPAGAGWLSVILSRRDARRMIPEVVEGERKTSSLLSRLPAAGRPLRPTRQSIRATCRGPFRRARTRYPKVSAMAGAIKWGEAFATASVPMFVAAPGLFSITKG
jgi:hypothetical protein